MEDEKESPSESDPKRGKLKERAFMFVFMVVIASFFAGVIAAANLALADRIQVNRDLFRQRKILEALQLIPYGPESRKYSGKELQEIFEERVRELTGRPVAGYTALTPEGEAGPIGILARWQGFWGPIEGIVSITSDDRRIRGIGIFSHSETPGLGARMTEPDFRKQFFAGEMKVPAPVEEGEPSERLTIDAITGATRTTESIVQFLNESLPKTVDRLLRDGPALPASQTAGEDS